MATLSSINLSREINQKTGRQLYFNRYRYAFSFALLRLSCIRNLNDFDRSDFHIIIARRFSTRNYWGWSPATKLKQSAQTDHIKKLVKLANFFYDHRGDLKLVIQSDFYAYQNGLGYVYTNHLSVLQDLLDLDIVHFRCCNEMSVTRNKNSIVKKSSEYAYRTYLREMMMETNHATVLKNFLNNRPDIDLSPTLRRWCSKEHQTYNYVRSYYYFDHNDKDLLFLLDIACPNTVRLTMDILKVNT